jgi:hypothetical protein
MDRDPIVYTIYIQRFVLITTAVSFLALASIVSLLDPFNQVNFWLFLFVLLVFLACVFCLISFWWVFSIQKKILTTIEVHSLLYHSSALSLVVVSILVFQVTGNLNSLILLGHLVSYLLYRIWLGS